MTIDRFRRAFKRKIIDTWEGYWEIGHLVKIDGSVADPHRKNHLWVRRGNQTYVSARDDVGVAHAEDTAVNLWLERENTYAIKSVNRGAQYSAAPATSPSGVPVHLHDSRYFTEAEFTGAADLGAPADTDGLLAVRTGGLGTILISALKTALNGLYVALTGAQTVAGEKTFSDDGIFGADIIMTKGGGGVIGPNIYLEATSAGAVDSEIGMFAAGKGSNSSSDGPSLGMRGNLFTRSANQRGYLFFVAGNPTGPLVGNDGAILFISYSTITFTINTTTALKIDAAGNVQIGPTAPAGKLHVDQSSTTAAIPALVLDQADISEPMIELETTVGVGNTIEAVGAKTLTTTHFLKVRLPDNSIGYIPIGTIA